MNCPFLSKISLCQQKEGPLSLISLVKEFFHKACFIALARFTSSKK